MKNRKWYRVKSFQTTFLDIKKLAWNCCAVETSLLGLIMFSCKCHVKLCVTCHLCSRCGCNHDGKEVEQKISRKRGCKEPKGIEGEPTTKRVCSDQYVNRDIYVSNRILRSASNPLIIPRNEENVYLKTEKYVPVTNITELFQVLGMGVSISVRKRLPAVQVRCDVNKWIDTS